jgi:hypothetical protein
VVKLMLFGKGTAYLRLFLGPYVRSEGLQGPESRKLGLRFSDHQYGPKKGLESPPLSLKRLYLMYMLIREAGG